MPDHVTSLCSERCYLRACIISSFCFQGRIWWIGHARFLGQSHRHRCLPLGYSHPSPTKRHLSTICWGTGRDHHCFHGLILFRRVIWDTVDVSLTHSGRDKMAAILQTTFWNAFSWMKMFDFPLKFHWILFYSWQYVSIGSDNVLAPKRQQVIIWTNDGLFYWHICVTRS